MSLRPRHVRGRLSVTIGVNTVLLVVLGVSQVGFEYVLGFRASTGDFENYVTLRNSLLLFMVVGSFGINEVIVRRGTVDLHSAYRGLFFLCATSLCCALLFYVTPLSIFDAPGMPRKGTIAACLWVFCVAQCVANIYRSQKRFVTGLLLRDGWRIAVWLCFIPVLTGRSYSERVVIDLLVVCAIVSGASVIRAASRLRSADASIQTREWLPREDVPLAFAFWMTMLSLVAVTYLDQMLLAALAPQAGELKAYSMAVLFVVTPFALFATATGTILVPVIAGGDTIKQHLDRWSRSKRAVALGTVLAVVGAVVYFQLLSFLLHKVAVSISPILYVILLVTGILRLAYAVPSSVVGAMGSHRRVGVLAKAGIGAILLQVALVYLFYHLWGISGVAAATCIVWTYRLLVGLKLIGGLSY